MKLQFTLIFIFNLLFINNVHAITSEAANCNVAYGQGDLVAAEKAAEKALNQNHHDRDALICQGRILSAKDDLNGALSVFKAADALSQDAFDKTVIAFITSHAYKAAKQYDQAIQSYQQTQQLAQQARHPGFERMSDVAIGDIYFLNKQYEQALNAYLEGNKLDANDNERAESFEKIALTYHETNQHESALEYQIKAFLMQEKAGTLDQYANASIELGRYYAAANDYKSAEKTLDKIIKFAKEQGGAYFEARGSYVLAQVKAANGDKEAARSLVDYAKSIAKNTHDRALEKEIDQETHDLF